MKEGRNKFIDEFIMECKAKAEKMGFDSIHDALVYLRKKEKNSINK